MSQIGLEILAQGDAAQDQLNYLIRTQDGRVVRSSTLVLRDGDGHVFGALCINIDVTELRFLARAIEELAGGPEEQPEPITFGDDTGQIIQAVIEEQELAFGHSFDRLTKQERLAIFRALDRRGVFQQFFDQPYPARTTIGATLRNILVEIDVIAVRGAG